MLDQALLERPQADAAAALAGFFAIMDLWGVGPDEARVLLGTPSTSTFYAWKRGQAGRPSHDTLRRIGYVAGIFKALQLVYAEAAQADGWIRRPNRFFGGQSPLERMLGGDVTDLAAVRAYADGARAPWS
jgi:uncharacterized protein (DUF2384 family)